MLKRKKKVYKEERERERGTKNWEESGGRGGGGARAIKNSKAERKGG